MRRMSLAMAMLMWLAGTGVGLAAENYAEGSLDRHLRLEWQTSKGMRGTTLDGYVYNMFGHPADRMMLRIDRLDPGGQVIGSSTTWVMGTVPPNNRAYFVTTVPDATNYRVTIVSFDWIGRGV